MKTRHEPRDYDVVMSPGTRMELSGTWKLSRFGPALELRRSNMLVVIGHTGFHKQFWTSN